MVVVLFASGLARPVDGAARRQHEAEKAGLGPGRHARKPRTPPVGARVAHDGLARRLLRLVVETVGQLDEHVLEVAVDAQLEDAARGLLGRDRLAPGMGLGVEVLARLVGRHAAIERLREPCRLLCRQLAVTLHYADHLVRGSRHVGVVDLRQLARECGAVRSRYVVDAARVVVDEPTR